jgi:hypothetical protein
MFIPVERQERSVTYQEGVLRRLLAGPVLHYPTSDAAPYDQPLDMTITRRNNAALDGWVIDQAGWRYAIGIPSTGLFAGLDGVVGFGGRRGSNWLKFRLERFGNITADGLSFTQIGSTASYTRSGNLSNNTSTIFLPDGSQQAVGADLQWRNLWTTPGGGEVYLRYRLGGDGLKEEVVITAAARNWLVANRLPSDTANTYLAAVFRVDWSDVPRRYINGILTDSASAFSDSHPIELRDAQERLLAFMPLDYAYVTEQVDTGRLQTDNSPLYEPVIHRRRLLKHFWGSENLLVGLKWSDLLTLPAGDLVLDPSFSAAISANSDNAEVDDLGYNDGASTTQVRFGGVGSATTGHGQGFRFPNVTIAPGATITNAKLQLMKDGAQWSALTIRMTAILEANTATFSDGARPGARAIATNIADENTNVNHLNLNRYDFPSTTPLQATLAAAVQEVINLGGWASGNALALICNSDQDASAYVNFSRKLFFFNSGGAGNEPILVIDYTGGGANTPLDRRGVLRGVLRGVWAA